MTEKDIKIQTIKAYVYLEKVKPTLWKWVCFPFVNVRMEGTTRTPIGAKRAAKRSIKRIGHKAEVEILGPKTHNKNIVT